MSIRFGWFIPSRTAEEHSPLKDHWKVFKEEDALYPFLMTDLQMDFIKKNMILPETADNSSR